MTTELKYKSIDEINSLIDKLIKKRTRLRLEKLLEFEGRSDQYNIADIRRGKDEIEIAESLNRLRNAKKYRLTVAKQREVAIKKLKQQLEDEPDIQGEERDLDRIKGLPYSEAKQKLRKWHPGIHIEKTHRSARLREDDYIMNNVRILLNDNKVVRRAKYH